MSRKSTRTREQEQRRLVSAWALQGGRREIRGTDIHAVPSSLVPTRPC
jgi:hypothetical protein